MTPVRTDALRIMLATDDSASARIAEAWVVRLRYARPPVIEVVCVAGRGLTRLGWGLQTYREPVQLAAEGILEGERIAAERIANEVGERLQTSGLVVHTWARQGDCTEELLRLAEVDRPDLVVVGPSGRSGLAATILGSVTYGLIAHTTQPLLVARPPRSSDGPLPARVLLVVDARPSAEAAVAWLNRAGWLAGAQVTMLGLLGERAGLEDGTPALLANVDQLVRTDASQTLAQLAEPLAGSDVSLDLVLREGHPLQAVLDADAELRVDLVAVGRPPRGPGPDPLAEKIARHARASVLLVPQR